MRLEAMTIALLAAMLVPAQALADQGQCEEAVRAAMSNIEVEVPIFSRVTTVMGGTEIKGFSLSHDYRSVSYDANEVPVSLSIRGDVYTTTDGGKTWKLVNSTPAEVMEERYAGTRKQAEIATDIACDYHVDLDGRTVHHFRASTIMQSGNNDPMHVQYWVDPENGFPWRVETRFESAVPTTIVQDNEPRPDATLPDPG